MSYIINSSNSWFWFLFPPAYGSYLSPSCPACYYRRLLFSYFCFESSSKFQCGITEFMPARRAPHDLSGYSLLVCPTWGPKETPYRVEPNNPRFGSATLLRPSCIQRYPWWCWNINQLWVCSGILGSTLVWQLLQAFRSLPRPYAFWCQDIPHTPLLAWPHFSRPRSLSRCKAIPTKCEEYIEESPEEGEASFRYPQSCKDWDF
jgi:hypothetical protein